MIRGIYLNGYNNDISECLNIRYKVYKDDFDIQAMRDPEDRNAVHILLYDENDRPCGTVRIIYDIDGDFQFSRLAVLPESRHKGNADFIMHMLFDKAVMSGAKRLISDETDHNREFFERYGFLKLDSRLVLNLKDYYKEHRCHD